MREETRRLIDRFVRAQARIASIKDSKEALDDLDYHITRLENDAVPAKYSARQYLLEFSRRGSVPDDLMEKAREPEDEDSALLFLIEHHIKLWNEHCKTEMLKRKLTRFQRFMLRLGRIDL
jgi:hypothetical protein